MITGFEAYYVYMVMKRLILSKSQYSPNTIFSNGTYKEKLKLSWNKKRADSDGYFFLQIEEKFQDKKDLFNLFLSYHVKNENFYVKHILDDNFETYYEFLYNMNNYEACMKMDYLFTCKDDIKKLIYGKPLPSIINSGCKFMTIYLFFVMSRFDKEVKLESLNNIEKEIWYYWLYTLNATHSAYSQWYPDKYNKLKLIEYFKLINRQRSH